MAKTTENLCCRTTLKILRICSIFPASGKEQNPGKMFLFQWVILSTVSSVTLIGSCLHFYMSMKDHIYKHVDIDLTIMVSMVSTYIFTSFLFARSRVAYRLLLHLSDFEENEKPLHFDKTTKMLDKFSLYHYIYLEWLVISLLVFSNAIKGSKCERENLELGLHEVCGLFSYTWMPFDIDYFPVKQIYLFLQLFGTHYLYMMAGTVSWTVVEIIQHIVLRLHHTKYLFIEAVKETDPRKQREKFNKAVRYHIAVLGLEDPLNHAFGVFMFTHVAMTAPILGTAIFAILHGGSGSSLFICLGWFLGVSLDCFSGQHLQNESTAIATALYDTDWYNCSVSMQKDVYFVLMRCRRPMYLKATSFGIMDHEVFLGILKATYSYIALLMQTGD